MSRGESLALDLFGMAQSSGADAAADDAADSGGLRAAAVAREPEIPFTWSEAHRHACEVRYCVSRGRAWSVEFCRGVADKRGRPAAERLWLDAQREGQWRVSR